MTRQWSRGPAVVLAAVVVLTALAALAGPASAQIEPGAVRGDDDVTRAERVLVVSLPSMRWRDVVATEPPVLTDLLSRSAVASMSLRTIGARPDLGRSYATIGAGNRATTRLSIDGQVYPPTATYEGGEARRVYERRCGCETGDAAAVHLGVAPIRAANERLLFDAVPGALGQALADAGMSAAVVANADHALAATSETVHREAAMAVMDVDGRVHRGAVGPQLLLDDPDVPFGVRTDVEAAAEAFRTAWDESELVLLEASDLDRIDRYSEVATPEALVEARRDAIARTDELLELVLDEVDLERHLVIVVGPSQPQLEPVQLTVASVAGPGFEPGLARSGTTRRAGYLTLPDLAPTALRALGVDVPTSMNGAPMASVAGPTPDLELFRELVADNEVAMFRNVAQGPVTVTFVVVQVLTYVLAVVALTGRRRRLRPLVLFLALTTMASPSVAFLSGLVRYDRLGIAGYTVAFFAAAAGIAGLAWFAGRVLAQRGGPAAPRLAALIAPLLLAGLILVVLLVDVFLGGSLQLDTVFGYGPTVAGRFAGYGNLAFALVAISAIVAATGVWGLASLRQPGTPGGRHHRLIVTLAAGLFTIVVLAIGLPQLGSDVGGVLASVPAFLITLLLMSGVALNWRRLALVAAATVVAIGAFGAFDLSRPEESRTHLGRFIVLALEEGPAGFGTVIERKLAANLNVLTSSVWTLTVPVALGFLAFLTWRQPSVLRRLQERMPGARACLVGGLVVAVLGGLLNDSGVAVPGMMFAVLLPYLAVVIVRTNGT